MEYSSSQVIRELELPVVCISNSIGKNVDEQFSQSFLDEEAVFQHMKDHTNNKLNYEKELHMFKKQKLQTDVADKNLNTSSPSKVNPYQFTVN